VAHDPKAVLADRSKYSLRRAAISEINARGIHYILVGDDNFVAEDFRDDPEAWGLTEVASGDGILLYKVTPQGATK
jgi:hypothetical protein